MVEKIDLLAPAFRFLAVFSFPSNWKSQRKTENTVEVSVVSSLRIVNSIPIFPPLTRGFGVKSVVQNVAFSIERFNPGSYRRQGGNSTSATAIPFGWLTGQPRNGRHKGCRSRTKKLRLPPWRPSTPEQSTRRALNQTKKKYSKKFLCAGISFRFCCRLPSKLIFLVFLHSCIAVVQRQFPTSLRQNADTQVLRLQQTPDLPLDQPNQCCSVSTVKILIHSTIIPFISSVYQNIVCRTMPLSQILGRNVAVS